MSNLKLTKPGFETYTGRLLGADFVNGVSNAISVSTIDTIAAAIGGVLVDDDGAELGPAGSFYRRPAKEAPAEPEAGA